MEVQKAWRSIALQFNFDAWLGLGSQLQAPAALPTVYTVPIVQEARLAPGQVGTF
jgi:hypothetical protein